ncbi:MAG: T9SS type A sorting domain-containing protein, partial [Bacteroidota bacterium]
MNLLRYLCLWCFIFTVTSVHAQYEYKPMVVEGAHWFILHDNGERLGTMGFSAYILQGDTILGDIGYKKLHTQFFRVDNDSREVVSPYQIVSTSLIGYLREDTTHQKVWAKVTDNIVYGSLNPCRWENPEEEILLFDFSLMEGDTIDFCYTGAPRGIFGMPIVIDSVRYVASDISDDNKLRKTLFYKRPPNPWADETPGRIIEGIGFDWWGLFPTQGSFVKYCQGNDNNVCGIATSLEETHSSLMIKISPNPAQTKFSIDVPLNRSIVKVLIYDSSGNLITDEISSTIHVATYPVGFYWVKVILNNGQS